MKVVDNKALELKVRNPTQITTAIPNSRYLGDGKVLVKWGLEEARSFSDTGSLRMAW